MNKIQSSFVTIGEPNVASSLHHWSLNGRFTQKSFMCKDTLHHKSTRCINLAFLESNSAAKQNASVMLWQIRKGKLWEAFSWLSRKLCVSAECFDESSAVSTSCLYLLQGFIHHMETDCAPCPLLSVCSAISHKLWLSIFRQKTEAIHSVWGALNNWSTLCQINNNWSAICLCCSTKSEYQLSEAHCEAAHVNSISSVERKMLQFWKKGHFSVEISLQFHILISVLF